jgi:hypothetical protein
MKLDNIARVASHTGPFLSAYVDVSRDTEDAARRIELAWRAHREQCAERGVPGNLADVVEERVLAAVSAPGQARRMVVAADDDVLVDDVVVGAGGDEVADVVGWGPLPDLTAWLADRATMLPVLLVVADREGADLSYHATWPGSVTLRDRIDGETLHSRKVPGGGWSHQEYQSHAEEVWRRNGAAVAERVNELAREHPGIVALAGDVRAVGEIKEAVDAPTRSRLVVLDHGSRAPGSSRESLATAIDHAVRDAVVDEQLGVVRMLQEKTGQRRAAAVGVAEVLNGLAQGQVGTLLLAPAAAAGQTVSPKEHPGLALPANALDEHELRADLAAVCAAAATGADLTILGGEASLPNGDGGDDGMAALLRWDDESTTGQA